MLLHQDWNYTNESKFNAYNVWIPLSDVKEENGAMLFIPGSHLWFQNFRSGSLSTSRLSYQLFPQELIKKVEVQKGQAVIFHPAVFHGSFPNHTDTNRIIVTATAFEKDAPFLYYQRSSESETEVYQLEDERFIKNLDSLTKGIAPESGFVEQINYKHVMITEQMIMEKLVESR